MCIVCNDRTYFRLLEEDQIPKYFACDCVGSELETIQQNLRVFEKRERLLATGFEMNSREIKWKEYDDT